jgi:hypothetical protein
MKSLLLLLATLAVTSCEQNNNPTVYFQAVEDYDTLFDVQNGNGHFVTTGLVGLLDTGLVTSALLTTIWNDSIKRETSLTKESYYLRDTMHYSFITEMIDIDSTVEQFDSAPTFIILFGELQVYYSSGDTAIYSDTLKFTRINPLTHQRINGKLVRGQRKGIWSTYYDYEKTLILRKSNFNEGLRHGVDSVFYADGKPFMVASWKNGKKDGIIETFSEYTGNVKSRVTFSNGFPISKMYYFDHYNQPMDSVDLNSL